MGRNIKWWSKAVAASLNVKATPLLMTFQFHSTADNFPASGTIIDCKCQVAFSLLPPKLHAALDINKMQFDNAPSQLFQNLPFWH